MPPVRSLRFTLLDVMIFVAATGGLFAFCGLFPVGSLRQPLQLFIGCVAFLLGFGGYGACAARWKQRDRREGFWWGFIFGPIGLVVVAFMPRESR